MDNRCNMSDIGATAACVNGLGKGDGVAPCARTTFRRLVAEINASPHGRED
jgi:hypothetical protein